MNEEVIAAINDKLLDTVKTMFPYPGETVNTVFKESGRSVDKTVQVLITARERNVDPIEVIIENANASGIERSRMNLDGGMM